MLKDFQVQIYHRPGPHQRTLPGHSYSGFYIQMKAKFKEEVKEPFDYQIRQVVIETRVGHVPNLLNSAAHRNTTFQPAIDYPNLVRDIGAENHMEIDFASDLEGFRWHKGRGCWYEYDEHCNLTVGDPDSFDADVKNWDIWLDDQPAFEGWGEGGKQRFIVYDFCALCQVVLVASPAPRVIAEIGPYTARWRGIWPYRKTNVPSRGATYRWDGVLLDSPALGSRHGYKDTFTTPTK
jgi:hypothetical protein